MIDEVLGSQRVIATLTVDDTSLAVPAARALVEGGVLAVEVMLRTPAGLAAIEAIRREVPEAIVGAGTVLTPELLEQAQSAGASFGVAPGFDAATVTRAAEIGIPFLPGAITPSEIQTCLAYGITTVKFFPASTSGGPATIKALSAAYSVAGVKFVATGGVDDTNAFDYLALPTMRAIGMSWLATSADVRAGNVAEIE
ncbi:MAG: bifunctional 4-hydroxy-2-oxoglutarate aldolase/2-dehydro-3-deoxy-phosphogluconate aldolase, partial [Ilumatobacteraceae bacterium]